MIKKDFPVPQQLSKKESFEITVCGPNPNNPKHSHIMINNFVG